MALTPMAFNPRKEKDSGWDVVAKAMNLAGSAVSIANGVKDLTKAATPPTEPPVVKPDTVTPQLGPNSAAEQTNSILRRMGRRPTYS